MPDEIVHLAVDGAVATITLDSPPNRNALSRQLTAELEAHIRAAVADPRVRVVVLTGTGSVFCSGADLKEQRAANEQGTSTGPSALVPALTAILEAPKPFIARVNGAARAGGIGLLAACDIAVGIDTASFAFSEVRIGVAPAIISVVCIPRMGLAKARELMLTGATFDGIEAWQYGLLDFAAGTQSDFDTTVRQYIDAFLAAAPGALAETKAMLRRVPGMEMREAFAYTSELSARLFAGEEALEGFTAFAEKRPPRWALAPDSLVRVPRGVEPGAGRAIVE